MADTVKKSRIVSEEEDNLEESLLEEFNMRLKNCMSKDDLQTVADDDDDGLYESVAEDRIPPGPKAVTYDFLQFERQYSGATGNSCKSPVEENIYETLPEEKIEKTDLPDQNHKSKSPVEAPESPKDVSNPCYEEFEVVTNPEFPEDSYELVNVKDAERPSFTLNLSDFSETESSQKFLEAEIKSSVKDRMFLTTDSNATLLFTQTVTSPMLTPSEENIDFLKGFQTENTNSEKTISTSNENTEKESSDKVEESNSSEEISASDNLNEKIEEGPVVENVNAVDVEENIYENADFLKTNSESIYENLKENGVVVEENIYENLDSLKESNKNSKECVENVYQETGDCKEAKNEQEPIKTLPEDIETVPSEKTDSIEEVHGENSLESSLQNDLVTDLDTGEVENEFYIDSTSKICVEKSHFDSQSKTVETSKVKMENEEELSANGLKESYAEFVHHSRTESNYYEKYTEVVSKNSKNVEISNREKDTETVPAEIVKNLKSQFLKNGSESAQTFSVKKEESRNSADLRTINIMKQINKFEHKDAGGDANDLDNSTVSETYSETMTFQSDNPAEKSLKKKKTKKSRKEEKENISVKSSFSKFDALQKKNVLHIRSSDSVKAQEKFNGAQQADTTNCKACAKQVFQMEQIKAEKSIWHRNCFRCIECSKQLTVETYVSHEGNLFCKPHFKSLFAPKVVEDNTPQRPRKSELIIFESQPVELPPDVVRASDKPDLGLEELQSLNVKERFQVFEQHQIDSQDLERGPTPVNVKRSPSILSKLARFQAKGMDLGVPDEALNGIPIEESSSEEEEDEEVPEGEDPTLYKAKRAQKEKPFHFTNLSEVKNKWEHGENSKEERREERKQEIQSIRNKIFMGKQGKMKEAYQQAVMQSESCANLAKSEKYESCDTKSLKERFEKGKPLNGVDKEPRNGEPDDESEVYQSEISKKSRSLFLELDAHASKPPQLSPVVSQKQEVKKGREAYLTKTSSEDTVKSSQVNEDVVEVKTADIQQRFKFFETYKEPEKERRQFRITPPRDPSQVKTETLEREVYHDPDVVRADEGYVDDSVIAKTTHTASKMLNKFRQMEESLAKEPEPVGPKPLKRFTPPPEPTRPEETSEDEGSSSCEEESEGEDEADQKVPDDDLLEAQKAARAKQLRAKFEKWEAQEIKKEQSNSVNVIEDYGDDSQVESTKSIRARFESMRETSSDKTRTPRVKVNRFVGIPIVTDTCQGCQGKVYPLEKISVHGHIYHRKCFKCMECSCVLRMESYSYNQGLLYCIPHFKRLFISKGNYDTAFGLDQHKEKWNINATMA